MKNRRIRFFQICILMLNIFSVMALSLFIYQTTEIIRRHFDAREFLRGVTAIPSNPRNNVWICGVLLTALAISFILRETFFRAKNKAIMASLIMDFTVSIVIVYLLNFNYNGILIMVFANLMVYIKGRKAQLALLTMAIACFLLADYNLLSVGYNLYSVNSYISYYSASRQQYLLGAYNILVSLNIVVFVMYCVDVIMTQRGTIDEVNSLNEQMEKVNEQMQEYAVMSEKMAQTKERNRLAREIHDTLGHTLTGIAAGLDACVATVEVSPEVTKKQLEVLSAVTRDGIREVRRSVSELRPDALERFSLDYAITKMVTDMNAMSGAKVYFNCQIKNLKFDEDEENVIYRVIQEGITNAIRHGNAKRIWITMMKENMDILLTIKDDGIGSKEIKSGFGTKHMKERIGMLGGTVSFDGNNGFTVNARIPIRWGETYD
ncbi:MAG: sensor histidine kinase [Eubacteriales bacterium]|nr:sensor histidine kinase [Eubacteriales bacterium]